jgi:hypothetical protein
MKCLLTSTNYTGFLQPRERSMSKTNKERLYTTRTTLERTLRVSYPAGSGRLLLRTEQDWEKEIAPVSVSEDGNTSTFRLRADQPYLYFKPCLKTGVHWARTQPPRSDG